MDVIIDTNVFVQRERSRHVVDFSQWEGYGVAAISVVTASELLVGVHRAKTENQRTRRSAFVTAILSHFPAIDFNMEVARVHAELFAILAGQGRQIGAHDLIIAATAQTYDCAVLTLNTGEFQRIPDLIVVEPT